jgi:membrane-associated phospholipid phosphatase
MRSERARVLAWTVVALVAWSAFAATPQLARIDRSVTMAIQAHASRAWDLAFSLVTTLGNVEVTAALVAVLGVGLIRAARGGQAAALWLVFAGGSAIEWLSKRWVAHPAVSLEFRRTGHHLWHVLITTPHGYPSGHAFRTLLLAAALMLLWPAATARGARLRRAALVLLPGVMGLALLYMGDHWLSEVVGGYLLACVGVATMRTLTASSSKPAEKEFAHAG